jgi:glyoxylase-like metal-dependent hydrolase (beta-lactamase superfamily II)
MMKIIHLIIIAAITGLLLAFTTKKQPEPELFDLEEVVPGVYAAIARPSYKLNGNAAFIINPDHVLVIDTHSKPSAARSLIRQIEKITSKPIRYVINTHFHYDHARGNQAYIPPDYEGATLVATETTRQNLINIGVGRLKSETEKMPEILKSLENELAGSNDKQKLQRLQDAREYYQELSTMKIILPSLTFQDSLYLHNSEREIRILFLGRAHTSSDAVVYLPKEKLLITSDLLAAWLPGMGDGYPNEWLGTLDAMRKLDVERIIVGHGEVSGPELIDQLHNYISDLIAFVKKSVANGETMAETEDSVYRQISPRYKDKYPADGFEFRVKRNIRKIYSDVVAKRY